MENVFGLLTSQSGTDERNMLRNPLTPSRLQHSDHFVLFSSRTNCPFMNGSARNDSPHRSCRALVHANAEYLRRLLDVFYADNIWQAWNEASEDMKAGSVCQNQEIINPHHPPRGPIWKSLVQNNVLLLLLVWKIITAIILRRITKTIREDLNYLLCS